MAEDDIPKLERRKPGRPLGSMRPPEQCNTVTVEVYVTPVMAQELRAAAYSDGMALSVIARRLLTDWLESRKRRTG